MGFFDDVQDWWNGLSDRWDSPHDDPWDAILDVMDIDEANRKKVISMASGLPVIGDLLKASDQYNYTQDYLDNRGMSWEQLKYPALVNVGGGGFVSGLRSGSQYVSRNIERLYKDKD